MHGPQQSFKRIQDVLWCMDRRTFFDRRVWVQMCDAFYTYHQLDSCLKSKICVILWIDQKQSSRINSRSKNTSAEVF